ncbi:MAG: dephospho-CoA kinase [Phycisphaera sp.]|nr:dephospho-CoA kinase [Phycisphaera sp.]
MQRFRPVIGICGGIGSGKSAVSAALRELGCEVCHSDEVARAVLERADVRAAVVARAGAHLARPDGSIDRAALGKAIFTDAALRADIEKLMHPRIEAERRAQFARAPLSTRAFIIDAPLLLEVGLDRECDAVIFVDAPHELRVQRVTGTRGWDAAELERRERAQIPLGEKRARSTDVVVNDCEPEELGRRVGAVLGAIIARGPARRAPSSEGPRTEPT